MERFDIVIKNGEIIDGSGCTSYASDIGIKNGKIVSISQNINADAGTVINAAGKVVSPGFIDPHAHNDGYILIDSSNVYKLAQGVTTEISGNCGEGLFPFADRYFDLMYEYYRPYYATENFRNFKSANDYFKVIDKLSLGTNVGYLCAHGTLRMAAMGFESGAPNDEQMEFMKYKLEESLCAGAFGMSTGLVYSPGCFADIQEIAELCRIVKKHNGIHASHIRSEGYGLIKAIEEVIEVARETGVRTVISHLKALGRTYWGLSKQITKMIEDAQAEGLEIYCDQYPYSTSCTVGHWVIPSEYTEGGFVKMCEKLSNPEDRQYIKEMFDNKHGEWDNLMENITPDGIHVLRAEKTPDAVGKTIQRYADEKSINAYDALFDIIVANRADVTCAYDCMSEQDIKLIMSKNYCMVGSDGIVVYPNEKTHPRLTGTFPRVLGKYVREEELLPLEKAIYKMTGLPAKVLNLKGKGCIKENYVADICIFDKNTVIDRGTYDDFNIRPKGIDTVLVNGIISFSEGDYTGAGSGKRIACNR